ncbi:hypothetical protein LTR85_007576 [Meristemomyces frigidus]|nr:hypothetical protein LTR85_007576 [Meristemomyces frigidus]
MKQSPSDEDEPEQEDNTEPTPTGTPSRPLRAGVTDRDTSARPRLVHSPPVRLSELPQTAQEKEEARSASRAAADTHGANDEQSRPDMARTVSGAEEERLAKLREVVNAKVALQQRKRNSYGAKRPSPIREEDGTISPSLTAAFNSPLEMASRPLSTVSTESTESARTVRASVPPTPNESKPLRTPSYPFPYVPGTPRTWSSSFHQPFTALSPTVTAQRPGDQEGPGHLSRHSSMLSNATTPGATTKDFMPPGAGFQAQEDPRFPTPNLYDMVLALNAEPGLEQWWATVTNMLHDEFKADRVTLIMPLDPTDIENVPWGQKATFSMNGREEFVPHRTVLEQTSHVPRPDLTLREPSTELPKDFQMQKLHPERLRPRLESRHSYAGPGRDAQGMNAELPARPGGRPAGPQRTMTHASGVPAGVGPGRTLPQRLPSAASFRHTSLSDPDFSSIAGGADAGPYAEVFPNLKALHHEVRPLIEPSGVNRVLERGRVVTVTRDYASESSDSSNGNASAAAPGDFGGLTPKETPGAAASRVFGNYRSAFASDNLPGRPRDYEEYEQYPTSPWAQSPAPSPAIQADEEDNPFFASSEEQQVEDSFNPSAGTPKDYSQYGQVEAIGVDHASTVIHIPLMHPTLSQPMQSLRMRQTGGRPESQRSNTVDFERRAPIAILSVLSPTVPYPPNWTHALKLLGPHLATSFATAQQFSSTHVQAVTIRHRRTASGHNVSNAPMAIEPASLEDIMKAELEEPPGSSSISGSLTSPSEYSGRSKHSPSSSIAGTPGWDPATHGWSSSKSVTGTPAITGSEMVDNYFEAKKRTTPRSGSNTSAAAHATPAKLPSRAQTQEGRSSARKQSPSGRDDSRHPHGEQTLKANRPVKEEKSALRQITERAESPTPVPDTKSPQRPVMRHAISHFADQNAAHAARRHSLLHSYGADFESSFGALQSPVGVEPVAPVGAGHARKVSYPEDMPPPSERLLRTIIDSVPVQIFTAKPDTGQLSWVNSKFLIYRGQEPRQVLSEPWQAIHPDDRSEFMASWHRSLRTAQQLQQKVRLERFDGSFRWFYVRAAPLKDKRQKIVHWIGTMMDFHEQHLAEQNAARQQETAASEAKYRALANSSPQVVFAVSKTKGVTFCNSQWLHYSGQTEAQALGVGFMDHVHPDDLVKCRLPSFDDESMQPTNVPTSVPPDFKRTNTNSAASSSGSSETEKGVTSSESSPVNAQMPQRKLSELATTGILKVARDADGRPSYSTEVRLKSKEGEFRWHLVRVLLAEPLVQSINEEETWYGTCTDINDHKTLERDLKENMDEKSRFLSNMSHEIRTPLNGITGMVNFLIDSNLSSEQMEHVNIIRASTEGLRGLINDILDLSKAEAGMIQLNMDWLYIRAIIEEVNDLTSAMAIDKGLELNYVVEDNVPSQVRGDRFRIRQVLLNVVGNAIKFTDRGEVFVRCSIQNKGPDQLEKNEMYIKFEVIDTGRGFTDQEAEYLFKRFSQIDGSSTRQHGGTGLGLVISRQLAQLHGGDMGAKGVPGKGSTFTLYIKTTLPSKHDQPPLPPPTPTPATIPILPMPPSPSPSDTPALMSKLAKTPSIPMPSDKPARASPRYLTETTQSPSPFMSPDGRDSPAASSASSDPSLMSTARTSSLRSERSSASSYVPDPAFSSPRRKLALPQDSRESGLESEESQSSEASESTIKGLTVPSTPSVVSPGGSRSPPMYSILVVCPLRYSREATVQHIDMTLPKNIPHQITARENLLECQKMLGGDDPVIFSHIVVMLQDVVEIITLMDQIFESHSHSTTSVVVITDLAQRRVLMEQAPKYDYEQLARERRLLFVFKPLKPSRFAVIFDPQKEREMSTDRNQDSAQQVALTQKQVFEELGKRLGNRDKRVLLVEDNRVNQMVILKFFAKVSITVETAMDGVQCTDKVFAQPHGYYSIILCDLHMPNKDGYQTCKEIRKWEKKSKYPHLPIIALSANVLGDVYQKCVEAGFNSYMTKPVDFKELSTVLMAFMDPSDPDKPHEFMKLKRGQSHKSR